MDPNVETLLSAVSATKYSTFAAFGFLAYDHFLTFDSEVEYIWKQRWSFGKTLFVINRYYGPLVLILTIIVILSDSLTDKFCSAFTWWQGISCSVAVMLTEIILQARIYAVYDRNQKLLVVTGALFLVAAVSGILVPVLGMPADPGRFVRPRGCYSTVRPPLYSMTWVPALAFEAILCILMLHKAWTMHRTGCKSPLLSLIVRDSLLYFFTIFLALLLNCLLFALDSQFVGVGYGWLIAVPGIAGSRLSLNMRERYFLDANGPCGPSKPEIVVRRDGKALKIYDIEFATMSPASIGTDARTQSC